MTEDKMVIPLRVPVELGREWKVEAAKAGKSVQKWLLGRMNFTEPVKCGKHEGARPAGSHPVHEGGATPPPTAKPVLVRPDIDGPILVGKVGGVVDYGPVATVTCFKCKEKVVKWTMDSRGKPWCDSCISDSKNAIA